MFGNTDTRYKMHIAGATIAAGFCAWSLYGQFYIAAVLAALSAGCFLMAIKYNREIKEIETQLARRS